MMKGKTLIVVACSSPVFLFMISGQGCLPQPLEGDAINHVPPTANAGVDQAVIEGAIVTLDGSGSYDPAGLQLVYIWTQKSGPPVTLSSSGTARPTFTAPQVSTDITLVFELVVTSTNGASEPDMVTVQIKDACEPDFDGDGVCDSVDQCPNDPDKTEPGFCGCGTPDIDNDDDGIGDACAVSSVCDAIRSRFDTSDEGWRIQGGGFSVPTPPFWDSDGFVSAILTQYGSFSWISPTSFHGNRSCLYGKTLSFLFTGYVRKGNDLVTLSGGGLQIYYPSPIENIFDYSDYYYDRGTTTGFSVRLDESTDWYNQETHQRASAQEVLRVLTNLNELRIAGSGTNGVEVSLDNVVMGDAYSDSPAGEIQSRFSINDEGWRIKTGSALPTAPFWNTDGFVSMNVLYPAHWLSPPSLLGNHSQAYGGTLSYDFVGEIRSGTRMVYLSGGGHMLYYPAQQKYSWTMTNVSILLHETGQWKDLRTGQRASQQQIQETLTDLTFLRITGNTESGEVALDNVVLQGP